MEEEIHYKTWGRSRSVRLKGFDYQGASVVYHVIVGTGDKRHIFVDQRLNDLVVSVLKSSCSVHNYGLVAYSLMPNHLHVLAVSREGCSSLGQFVRAFKSYTTRAAGRRLWQRGYCEHIMRKEEDVLVTARYIINNPVRKNMVKRPEDYRWAEIVRVP